MELTNTTQTLTAIKFNPQFLAQMAKYLPRMAVNVHMVRNLDKDFVSFDAFHNSMLMPMVSVNVVPAKQNLAMSQAANSNNCHYALKPKDMEVLLETAGVLVDKCPSVSIHGAEKYKCQHVSILDKFEKFLNILKTGHNVDVHLDKG